MLCRTNNDKSRLGSILVKKGLISDLQLNNALKLQQNQGGMLGSAIEHLGYLSSSQIRLALKKQQLLRVVASSLALICGPVNFCAADTQNNSFKHQYKSSSFAKKVSHTSHLEYSKINIDDQSKAFYFSGDSKHLFSVNAKIGQHSGLKFSVFSEAKPMFGKQINYEFDPQISLYSSEPRFEAENFSPKTIGPGLDRASNTHPIVYMLTLKGRSIYENTRNYTKLWSLNRAKKGVQRKAVLMFSITKQF